MKWTVVVPLKAEPLRKSRLAAALPLDRRIGLSAALHRHVMRSLARSGLFADSMTLSPTAPPAGVPGRWRQDNGLAVNVALSQIRDATPTALMVVNSDLPLLRVADIKALAMAAVRVCCAIAGDRDETGTNAVAVLPGATFAFAFGPGSLQAHRDAAPQARVLRRIGLAYDLDTVEDIAAVLDSGRDLPADIAHWLKRAGNDQFASRL